MKVWKMLGITMAMLTLTQVTNAQDCRNRNCHAQDNPQPTGHHDSYNGHEFAISFGVWPIRPNNIFNSCDEQSERYSPYELTAEYMYHPTKRFSLGLNLTYIPVFNDEPRWEEHRTDVRHTAFGRGDNKYEETIIVIMPSVRMEWVKCHAFSLYSRLAAGVGVELDEKTDKTYTGFTYQVVPVGLTIGHKVYCRLEFPSFGYQGLFNAGIGCKF